MDAQELDAKLKRRIANRSRSELLEWLQVAFGGCMRYAEDYQNKHSLDALGELNLNLAVVNAVVDELVSKERAANEDDD